METTPITPTPTPTPQPVIVKIQIPSKDPRLKRHIHQDSRSLNYTLDTKKLSIVSVIHGRHIGILNQGNFGSCFDGDTLIKLINGKTKTIRELTENNEEFWVYTVDDNGSMVPAKAVANLTGINRTVIKVTLDNGEIIICTPDHEFMLRDGSYKKVIDIDFNESLMPNYLRPGPKTYEQFYDNFKMKWTFTHTKVNNFINSEYKELVNERIKNTEDRFLVTHHKDFDKYNNSPENLEWMGELEHGLYHTSAWNGTEEQRAHSTRNINRQYAENPLWNAGSQSKGGKATQDKARKDPEFRKKVLAGFALGHTPEVQARAAITRKITLSTPEHKERQRLHGINLMKKQMAIPGNIEKFKEIGKELGSNSGKSKAIFYAKQIIDSGIELNEQTWNDFKIKRKLHNFLKYNTALKYFNSLEDFKDAAINYNHKIVSIEYLEETRDVYCLTVEKYHNFALNAGVFVHNCTGNAGIGNIASDPIFAALPKVNKYTLDEPGAQHLYSDAEIIDGDGPFPPNDNGSSGLSIAKALVNAGLISGYQHVFTSDDALKAASLYPFIFGTNWYNDMFNPDKDGRVHITGALAGGHEVVCRQIDVNNQRVWFDNSWGSTFGVNGRFYLTFADFATLLSQQGDVVILLPLTVPAPTPVPPTPPATPAPIVNSPIDITLAAAMHTWLTARGL